MSASGARLLEREAELAVIASALAGAGSGSVGSVVLIEGSAGIGKSALIDVGAGLAADRGFLVLRARGTELERDDPYGMARQLFEPLLRRASPGRRSALLGEAAAAAAPALGMDPDGGGPFAVRHGLYWLLDALACEQPVLVCVDDAQWSDAATLRWLAFLAGRIDGLAAAVLLGWRAGEPTGEAVAVESIRGSVRTSTLRPAALTGPACHHAVRLHGVRRRGRSTGGR